MATETTVPLNVRIYGDCDTCGEPLVFTVTSSIEHEADVCVTVQPCATCLDNARDEAHSEGFECRSQEIYDLRQRVAELEARHG